MIKVEATSYSLVGSQGQITLTWKSETKLKPNNKEVLIEAIENSVASMINQFEQSI